MGAITHTGLLLIMKSLGQASSIKDLPDGRTAAFVVPSSLLTFPVYSHARIVLSAGYSLQPWPLDAVDLILSCDASF